MVQSVIASEKRREIVATITKRENPAGKIVYRVRIRQQGYPDQSATFSTKKKANDWAKVTEAAIIEGRHFASKKAKRRTLADAIERYTEDNLPKLSKSVKRCLTYFPLTAP